MFKKFHMVRTGLLIVVVTAGINLCFGQMYWTNSFTGGVYPRVMQPTRDGNYIIAGFTNDPQSPSIRWGWFAKLNPNGDTLWTKILGVPEAILNAIVPIDGDFFLLVGSSKISGLVVKINTNGDVIWTRTYDKSIFFAGQKCTDGNFLIAGVREEINSSVLVKISPDGDTLWTRSSNGFISSIQVSSDKNYLVAGVNRNSVSNLSEILLLKIDNAGKIIWTRNLRSSKSQEASKIYPAGDGNYLLIGESSTDGLVVKITPEGDTIWTRIYSTPALENTFTDIISSIDGCFLIIGYRNSGNTGYNEWFLKINQKGDTLWTRKTTTSYYNTIYESILPAGNGTFLVLGTDIIKWMILCLVEDQYAKKDSTFSFKIPTRGLDSLNCGYQPLKVPSGMTVSAGGTVSWTPQTDSSYLENAKFVVADDQGRKDTLSLNIFVNMKNQSSHTRTTYQMPQDKAPDVFTVLSHSQRGKVQFNFPASAAFLSIYDMSGRLVDRINPVNSTGRQTIIWPATGTRYHSGQYIAQAVVGKKTEAKVFMLER